MVVVVDDDSFPYAFVTIEGNATIHELTPDELLPYATDIARRYVGDERAAGYGKRNAVEGEVLVRVVPTKVIAAKGVSE